MKTNPIAAIAISAVLAALVWVLSNAVTGNPEPWDGSMAYYLGGLFLAGFVSAWIAPRPVWTYYLGALIGQVAYMLFAGAGAMILAGALFTALFSVAALAGAFVAKSIRKSKV